MTPAGENVLSSAGVTIDSFDYRLLALNVDKRLVQRQFVQQVAQVVDNLVRISALQQLCDLSLTLGEAVALAPKLVELAAKLVQRRSLRRDLAGDVDRPTAECAGQAGLHAGRRGRNHWMFVGSRLSCHKGFDLLSPRPPSIGGRIFSRTALQAGGRYPGFW
jgi:hypothetical protein